VRAVIAATIAAFLVSAIDCSAASFPTMLVGGDPNRLRNNSQVVGLVCAPNVTIKHIAAFGIMGTITHEFPTELEYDTCCMWNVRTIKCIICTNASTNTERHLGQFVGIPNESFGFYEGVLREDDSRRILKGINMESLRNRLARGCHPVHFHYFIHVSGYCWLDKKMVSRRSTYVQKLCIKFHIGELLTNRDSRWNNRDFNPGARCGNDALLSDAGLGDALLCLGNSGGSLLLSSSHLLSCLFQCSQCIRMLLSDRIPCLINGGQRILMRVGSGNPGILHGPEENYIGDGSKEYRQDEKYYRKLFTRSPLIIIGLFLFFCGYKLVANAVKRADYLHVIFVLLAFLLFAFGFAAFLYVIGFWDAIWH